MQKPAGTFYSQTLSSVWASIIFVLLTLALPIYFFVDASLAVRQRLILAAWVLAYSLIGTVVWRWLQREYQSSQMTVSYFLIQTITGLGLFASMVVIDMDAYTPLYAIPLFLQAGVLPLKQRWWVLSLTLLGVALLNTYGYVTFAGGFELFIISDTIVDVVLLVSFGFIGHYLIHEEALRQQVERLVGEIERRRRKEKSRFEQLNKMRTEFVNSATHDLKNPLGIIMGYAHILLDDLDEDTPQREYAQQIVESSEKMQDLILDMLDLARIESGLQLQPEEVRLSSFLEETVDKHQVAAQQKNIRMNLGNGASQTTVMFDPRYMVRVFDNLLSNAIKYTAAGGTVTITTRVNSEHYMVSIKDTGDGIPANDLPHIFEPFYRIQKIGQRHEGTGLGLSIVKSIVEQHQGIISVQSETGEGSTFTVTLPIWLPLSNVA